MAIKLYVGNLSWGTTQESLKDLFSSFGEVVSASIITDKMTGKSRGFGFVEFKEQAAAESAVAAMNGKEVDGRMLTVNEARPMADRPRREGFGSNDRGDRRSSY